MATRFFSLGNRLINMAHIIHIEESITRYDIFCPRTHIIVRKDNNPEEFEKMRRIVKQFKKEEQYF